MRKIIWTVALVLLVGLAPDAPRAEEDKLPSIVILATGGTIAGVSPSETDAGYKPGVLSVDVLIRAVPELEKLAKVRGEQIANIASQNMTDEIWLKLAKRVNELLRSDEVDGIVITHGTDTLEETAYFLHLVTKSVKPVVVTGAMRASTSLSPDGPMNLYNSIAVAADPKAASRGVMVVMNDGIHEAREATKKHTTALQTFASPRLGPMGSVHYGEATFFRSPDRKHTTETPFGIDTAEKLPRVLILFGHANLGGDLIDAAVKLGVDGIVMAGVGNGNMSTTAIEAMARAVKAGVAVVRTSRIGVGPVFRNYEIDDDKLGFVAGDTLSPQKARILLKLALTVEKKPEALQVLFRRF